MDQQEIIAQTRDWIASMVIGLNLCPFAERVFKQDTIRYVVTEVSEEVDLLSELTTELQTLVTSPREKIETTLLIHPNALDDFLDHNDFLGTAEELIESMGLTGTVQLVGFHPAYRFHGVAPQAAENYTNRSPYPMIHLLREESISEVASSPEELLEIPKRNIETLNRMGIERILQIMKRSRD